MDASSDSSPVVPVDASNDELTLLLSEPAVLQEDGEQAAQAAALQLQSVSLSSFSMCASKMKMRSLHLLVVMIVIPWIMILPPLCCQMKHTLILYIQELDWVRLETADADGSEGQASKGKQKALYDRILNHIHALHPYFLVPLEKERIRTQELKRRKCSKGRR